jgi:hypothetical protein
MRIRKVILTQLEYAIVQNISSIQHRWAYAVTSNFHGVTNCRSSSASIKFIEFSSIRINRRMASFGVWLTRFEY